MKRSFTVAAAMLIASATSALAQQTDHKASTAAVAANGIAALYNMSKANIVAAADQMPEDKYAFQATKDVRSFGQLIGHIADAQNFFCAQIAGAPKQYAATAEKLATKAELVGALKASFATCDAAIAAVTDAELVKPLTIFGNQSNVAGAMTFVTSHNWEHYGNIVTYMRLNSMVPPSSQN
jgi:uncharacterized damage-inducible protein DinB